MKFELQKGEKLISQKGETYTVLRANGTVAVRCFNLEHPSKTHQEFADECDLNNLMRKYSYDDLPDVPETISQFSQCIDYHDMMEATRHANNAFQLLPAKIRQRFQNNPQELITFINDDKNRQEAIELGLIEAKPAPQPDPHLEELKKLNENFSKTTEKK